MRILHFVAKKGRDEFIVLTDSDDISEFTEDNEDSYNLESNVPIEAIDGYTLPARLPTDTVMQKHG